MGTMKVPGMDALPHGISSPCVEKGGFPTPPGPVKQWTHPSGPAPPCPTLDLAMACYFLTHIIKSHEHNCYLVIFAVFSYYFVMV